MAAERSGQVIAYLTVVMIFVTGCSRRSPAVSCSITFGWRAIFFLCAAIGLGALATLAICLPETNLTRRADLGLRSTLASFRRARARSALPRTGALLLAHHGDVLRDAGGAAVPHRRGARRHGDRIRRLVSPWPARST